MASRFNFSSFHSRKASDSSTTPHPVETRARVPHHLIDVVDPTDVWVLDPTSRPSLTLVTCYPFNYIGAAPRRFIVRATLADSPQAQ